MPLSLALTALIATAVPITQPPAAELLDDAALLAAMTEIAESPRARLEIIGRTHEGRPIPMLIVADSGVLAELGHHLTRAEALSGPLVERRGIEPASIVEQDVDGLLDGARLPVLFAGASWGNEASSVEGLVAAARFLVGDDADARRARSGTIALIVPLMNPDGRAAAIREWRNTPKSNGNSGIGNAWGFLINRDFVHATQPESRAIVDTVLRYRPVIAVDHHEDVYRLGVRLDEVAFVEPFIAGFDVEEHPASRDAIRAAGIAIAERWRAMGFRTLFDADGDNRFAPLPAAGEGLNPVVGSAGRLNLMASLHGVTSFITESARTPGSQSWEDRVLQKSSAVIATLQAVSAAPARFARAVYERRRDRLAEMGDRFVVVPLEDQPADRLAGLLEMLALHRIDAYRVETPRSALVVPLAQSEGEMAQHLLAPVRSVLNAVPSAMGLEAIPSERLNEDERAAFRSAEALPALAVPPPSAGEGTAFFVRPGIAATALINEALASGAASAMHRDSAGYRLRGDARALGWLARRHGVMLTPAGEVAGSIGEPVSRPRIALYAGQGVARHDWGQVAWVLRRGGFDFRVIDERGLADGSGLNGATALIMPNGNASVMVSGFDPEDRVSREPWQPAEPARGIGADGLEAIREFVGDGGAYIGIGGGAALAGPDHLKISRVIPVDAAVGLGPVRLSASRRDSPLLLGFGPGFDAFFFAPPGGPESGFAFEADDSAVAVYAGARDWPPEQSFTDPGVLSVERGLAAITLESHGNGRVVLFGIEPTFRGQWPDTWRLLYNALLMD